MHKDHIHFDGLADWGQIVSVWMKNLQNSPVHPRGRHRQLPCVLTAASLVEAMSIRRRPTIVHCKGHIRTLAFMELVRLADLNMRTQTPRSAPAIGKNSSADIVDSNWHSLAMAMPLGSKRRNGWAG